MLIKHMLLLSMLLHVKQSGDISSEDLVNNIPGSEVIDLDNIADLTKHKNAVVVFMGAGDIPKYEDAYEKLL
jgi:UDP-N-acetylmuramate-alanine ligase